MRNALFWLSLPFLLPQALWVRRTAPRFDGAAGASHGSVGNGPVKRLFMYGDSIAAGVGASEFPAALVGRTAEALASGTAHRIEWRSEGYIGENSTDLLARLRERPGEEPVDYLVLSVGVNDVTALNTLDTFRDNFRSILERLNEVYGEPCIGFCGLPPMHHFPLLPEPLRTQVGNRSAEIDGVARDVISGFSNAVHVPIAFELTPERFAPDGYHPSEFGYIEYGRLMSEALCSVEKSRAATSIV